MGKDSGIQWTHHTFNPWWGCQRVSPGCEHCYAETTANRFGLKVWGQNARRKFFGDMHWAEPFKWDRAAAAAAGERHRVFCASMADVFEDRRDLDDQRARLWRLIEETRNLDWLLLTKRPENMIRMVPGMWRQFWPENVWAGTTVEDQRRAEERIPHLLGVPARVRFLSVEPQLGPVDLTRVADDELGARCNVLTAGIGWVIVGGESGPGAREFQIEWPREILEQCRCAGVPCFVKQFGSRPLQYVCSHDELIKESQSIGPFEIKPSRDVDVQIGLRWFRKLRMRDAKGGDWNEWPADLRVREFPR